VGIRYTRQMASRNGSDAGLFAEEKPRGGWITAYCDGGSRGNPGPAGFGVFIQDETGGKLAELSEFLGTKTNNFAEYSGLLAALNFALEQGRPRLRVVSDSELMVKQIKGQYRVNSPDLKPLYDEARRRIARLESFQIQHVLRDKNRQADQLANLAMDRGTGRPSPAAYASQSPAAQPKGAPRGASRGKESAPNQPLSPEAVPIVAPIPIVRGGADPGRAELGRDAARPMRGFVKAGVVHLLDGARLPDGIFVKVTPES
jgi:ribonuclease HI